MATIPALPVFAATTGVTSAQLTELAAATSFAMNPPRVLVYRNVSVSVPTGTTPLVITWNTAIVNTDTNWSSANYTRLICNTPGLYEIDVAIHYAVFSTGALQLGVALNNAGGWPAGGSTNRLMEQVIPAQTSANLGNGANMAFPYFLNAGDYIEAFTLQDSGAAVLAMPNGTYFDGHFGMRWISVT